MGVTRRRPGRHLRELHDATLLGRLPRRRQQHAGERRPGSRQRAD